MANIKKIEGKIGTSYKTTVTQGWDMDGKQICHYKTWTPDRPMTAKQMEKEVKRMAFDFKRQIQQGFQPGDHQTFAEYAEYVLVPYNAAAKVTPPSVQRKTPNYFQPEEIAALK